MLITIKQIFFQNIVPLYRKFRGIWYFFIPIMAGYGAGGAFLFLGGASDWWNLVVTVIWILSMDTLFSRDFKHSQERIQDLDTMIACYKNLIKIVETKEENILQTKDKK